MSSSRAISSMAMSPVSSTPSSTVSRTGNAPPNSAKHPLTTSANSRNLFPRGTRFVPPTMERRPMFAALLGQVFKEGALTIIWPDGSTGTYGSGPPKAALRLHGRWTPFAIALKPDLAFGEAYMDGRVTMEQGTIADVFELGFSNVPPGKELRLTKARERLRKWARPISQFNPVRRARRNVAHHYDLSGELFDLFLDTDRQYSCAYFEHPKMTLEAAQAAKKRHIAAKLRLDRPGLKVLDIGSGWGGLALDLAREARADVLGVTLSTEQLA